MHRDRERGFKVLTRLSHQGKCSGNIIAISFSSLIFALLILSSLSIFVSATVNQQLSEESHDGIICTEDKVISRLDSDGGITRWNWIDLADDAGFVDVIFSFSDDVISISDMAEEWSFSPQRQFSLTFSGFSAHINAESLMTLLSIDTSIKAYPDFEVHSMITESVVDIGADQLWSRMDSFGNSVTGNGIVVAVIDTGVDYSHPDLGGGFGTGYKVIGGYDFYNDDSDPMDDNGHGTHVAGIIAANGGISGVAPDAEILAYKALGPNGSGSMSHCIAAIEAAMDPNGDGDTSDHADIISMSLGGPGESGDPISLAVRSAVEAGVAVVVAAGNDGPLMGTVASPGIEPTAITVGAVDDDGVLAGFSSRGTTPELLMKPEISAPGVSIYSTVPFSGTQFSSSSGYFSMSGTSMATPHVSGAAALLLQLHPDWTPQEIKSALVLGANELGESLWSAGAGEIWLPESADMDIFISEPLISYGLADSTDFPFSITNSESATTLASSSVDYFSLSADGLIASIEWANLSIATPSSLVLGADSTGSMTLAISSPSLQNPEGYYDGFIHLVDTSHDLRVPFGYAVLSRLNVHVLDNQEREVYDPYGGVWAYDIPNAAVAMGIRGSSEKPAPPTSFLLPSGQYSVHAAGHQLLYTYSDPYLLSDTVSLGHMETVDVYLRMSTARQMTLDLETDEGKPIFVKDYRIYCRYVGESNVSFHLVGSDYSITGEEIFSLSKSKIIYVSDTTATIGISIAGFSYSSAMWDFMSRNWQHWYEYASGSSTEFYIEASTDLQYLLAWEFDGIDDSVPLMLTVDPAISSVYETKYDIPGELSSVWCDWGGHRSIGGDASFYMRRDTDTSLNSFFSGMTRITIVQGVFSELYYPGNLFDGFSERQLYSPDYDHLVRAATVSEIYLPDRNFLTAIDEITYPQRLGAGPFYPSLYTSNTNDSLVLFHPILRDRSGAKVGGINTPMMNLYRDGALIGTYLLSEFLARPDAKRIVDLSGTGSYSAVIEYSPSPQICNDVTIELGFSMPSDDLNPPIITGINMEQRFTPGEAVPLELSAIDDLSVVSVEISWRNGPADTWRSLSVSDLGSDLFYTSIQTSMSDSVIDLRIRASDSYGNYIEYIASNAALQEIPVSFDLSTDPVDIGFRNTDEYIIINGHLTDLSGNPLHSVGGVPLELTLNGEKIGMILDEYIDSGTHVHNGDIRFEWHFNPINLFSGPDETIDIAVAFDLGIYEQITRTISLHSIQYTNELPVISLISPNSGSLIAAGELIDLEITDDGAYVIVDSYLDGSYYGPLSSPWDVDTATWSDGLHLLDILATDDELATASAAFTFDVDASPPIIEILYPANDSIIPSGSLLITSISDRNLAEVFYSVNGGAQQPLAATYTIDLTGWAIGNHMVSITAYDAVGHSSSESVYFEIASSTIVINLVGPDDGDIIQSGIPIIFSVSGAGTISCTWSKDGITNSISPPYEISTAGWSDGEHDIVINATSDLGGWFELEFSIVVDDTIPVILLEYPANGSFVGPLDQIWLRVIELNFDFVSWTIWGQTYGTGLSTATVQLTAPSDGPFTVEVEALDLAGNTARDTFVFAMDSSPPSVAINNVDSGDAIRPGYSIDVTATDQFLTDVQYVVDDSALTVIDSPYTIHTQSLASGWHDLQVIASDASGKNSSLNISFYIDGISPEISIDPPQHFLENDPLEIVADISDDFGIGNVVLYYELEGGSFSSKSMIRNGTAYVASLSPDLLWDNMSIYVSASDTAGNIRNGDIFIIPAYGSSYDGEDPGLTPSEDTPQPNDSEDEINTESESDIIGNWILIACIIGAIGIMSAYLILGYRSSDVRSTHIGSGKKIATSTMSKGARIEKISRDDYSYRYQKQHITKPPPTAQQIHPKSVRRTSESIMANTGPKHRIYSDEPTYFEERLKLTLHTPSETYMDLTQDTLDDFHISREDHDLNLDKDDISTLESIEPRIINEADRKRFIGR